MSARPCIAAVLSLVRSGPPAVTPPFLTGRSSERRAGGIPWPPKRWSRTAGSTTVGPSGASIARARSPRRLRSPIRPQARDAGASTGGLDVRIHGTGVKRVHHPIVGDLDLTFEMLQLTADPGLNLLTYSAETGTPSEEALNLLGSWAATLE